MSQLLAARTAQRVLVSEAVLNFNDWVVDSATGVKKTLGSTVALADPASAVAGLTADTGFTFDAVNVPRGATLVGGEVIVETAYAGIGVGATLSVGIAGNTTALVNAMDLDAATSGSRSAFALTAPLVANSGQNLRVTVAGMTAGGATAGKVRIRSMYTIDGRAEEVTPA